MVVGTARRRIVAETMKLLGDPAAYQAMVNPVNPFGDGHSAERIAAAIANRSETNGSRPRHASKTAPPRTPPWKGPRD